jgi:hypothetical protein
VSPDDQAEPDPEEAIVDGPAGTGGASQDRVSYDCSPWAGETRRLLAGILTNREITHVWEGTVLVVRAEDEAQVDELVDEMLATSIDSLDPGLPTVAYEVSVLPTETQNEIVQALNAEGVPHEWDADGDIVIHEQDASLMDVILDDLTVLTGPDGDQEGAIEIDGLELHDRLTALFVAADRLSNEPADRRASLDLLDADEALDGVGVPFGLDRSTWQEVLDASADLVDALREAAESGGRLHEAAEAGQPGSEGGEPEPGPGSAEDETRRVVRVGARGASKAVPAARGGVPVLRDGSAPEQESAGEPDAEVEPSDEDPRPPDTPKRQDTSVQAQARRLRDLLRPML